MANGAAGRPAGHHHGVSPPLPVWTHGHSGSGLAGCPRPVPGPGGCPCLSARRLHRLTQLSTCLNTGVIFTGLVGCREISLPEDPQYEGEGNFQGPRLADPHRHLPVHLRPPRDGGVRFRPEDAGRHVAGKHGLLRIKNQPAGWLSAVFASSRFTMAAVGRAGTPWVQRFQACPKWPANRQTHRRTITDLKARGLLDSTLVLWGGKFRRTPTRTQVGV